MEIVPIATKRWHGNDLYPLPPNYTTYESNPELLRRLRVNACRQWMLKRGTVIEILSKTVPLWDTLSPEVRENLVNDYLGDAFLASVRFFDEYYLKPDPPFDSGFYDDDPLPNAPFHSDMIRGWRMYAATLDVCPRGSAKSMTVRKAALLCMASRPGYKILYCTSSDKNATETSTIIRNQLYTNPRIQEDWSPEMPENRIKPMRGDLPTGIEWFTTASGSQFVTFSVNSKMRGGRPMWFILDDPEYDPHASTSMPAIRSFMRDRVFKVATPMLMRRQAHLSWLATFVSKRHYAFQAFETEKILVNENGTKVVREVAKIPEFEFWQRRLVVAAYTDETGKQVSCWPHMWPVDDAEKEALNLDPTTYTLADVKARVGAAIFASEYMGKPGESNDSYFRLNETAHAWWFDRSTIDENAFTHPTKSAVKICWNKGEEQVSMPLTEFLEQCKLFITIDTSKTARPDSDFKVATLMAVTEDQDLFVLDMWAAQCHPERLILASFDMASRWSCRYIYVEGIDDGLVLARTMRNMIQRLAAAQGPGSLPIVRDFNPGFTTKNTKISALIMRFEHGKIKLPFQRRMAKPWADLFEQVESFNPDVEDGGLRNDDHLDTISMSEYVLGAVKRTPKNAVVEEEDALKLIEQGKTHSPDGQPLVAFLDLATFGPRLIELMKKKPQETVSKGESLA